MFRIDTKSGIGRRGSKHILVFVVVADLELTQKAVSVEEVANI